MMKLLSVAAIILTLLQVSRSPTGAIEGVVTQKGSGTAVAEVRIEVEERFPSSTLRTPFAAETKTDGSGRFMIRDVPSGEFEVRAVLEGYLRRADERIAVSPWQTTQLAVELTPAATVRGRVTDSEDRPVASMNVEVLQQYIDEVGKRRWRQFSPGLGDRTDTNRAGEYRIPSLAPGIYYVRITRVTDRTRESVYFPGTEEPDAAASIVVAEGAEVIADIRMPLAAERPSFRISGKLVYPFSSVSPQRDPIAAEYPAISLIRRDRTPLHDDSISGRVDPVTGRFEILAVPPGAYHLLANVAVGVDGKIPYSSTIPVDLRDHDIEDLAVAISTGIEVKAHIVTDGDPEAFLFSSIETDLNRRRSAADIRVALKEKDTPLGPHRISVDESRQEIRFSNVPEGTYEVSVSIQPGSVPLNPDFFVEDVRVAGRSVYDNGIRVGLDPVDSVEIVIGTRGGSINGTIAQQGKTAAVVILIPDSFRRNNTALYKRENVPASDGKVQLRGIAPGSYRIFAVPDTGESLPFRSPEFVSRYAPRALPVTLQKGATVGPVQIPLLPLEH